MKRLLSDGWTQVFLAIAVVAGGLCLLGGGVQIDLPSMPSLGGGAVAPAAVPAPAPAAPASAQAPGRPKDGKAWVVDPAGGADADAATLTQAIALAAPGDAIVLRRGTHRDSAVVDKKVRIFGEGKLGETVLAGVSDFALSIRAERVSVTNLAVAAPKGPHASAVAVAHGGSLGFFDSSADGQDALAALVVEGAVLSSGSSFSSTGSAVVSRDGQALFTGGSLVSPERGVLAGGPAALVRLDSALVRGAKAAGEAIASGGISFVNCRFDGVAEICWTSDGGTCGRGPQAAREPNVPSAAAFR